MKASMKRELLNVLTATLVNALVVFSPGFSAAGQQSKATRRLEAADIMRMESIGQVAVADRTGSIAYTRLRPYESATRFDIASPSSPWGRADVFLWQKGDKAPRLLDLPHYRERSYNLGDGLVEGSFSPNGNRLILFWTEEDRIRFGVYDLRTGKLVEIPSAPNSSGRTCKPVWVNDDEIVFASIGDAWSSYFTRGRAIVAARMGELWKEAFRGKVVTAEVVRSYRDPAKSIQYDEGRLVLFNVSTKAERTLGKGRFSAINVSPDGRLIAALRHSRPHQLADAAQNANQSRDVKHTLRIYSVQGGERTVCDECHVVHNLSGSISWSSDSRYLSFFARSFGEPVEAGRYYRLRLEDFELRPYAHPGVQVVSYAESLRMFTMPTPAFQTGPDIAIYGRTRKAGEPAMSRVTAPYPGPRGRADWYLVSADGTAKNLTAGIEGVAPTIVYADGDSFVVPAGGELWRLSGSRPAENLTAGIADPVAPAGAGAGSPTLTLIAMGAARRALSFDAVSGKYAAVEFPSATAELKGITRDGTALFVDSTSTGTSLEIRGSDAQGERKIFTDSFNTHRREIAPPRWQPISYTYKGKDLTSCALLPNDYVAGRRYPAVFHVYTGRESMRFCQPAGKPLVFQSEGSGDINFLATRGYVVVHVASPSELVFEDGDAMKGLGGTADAALDAAARAGFVDPERAGIAGRSGGGISALQIATQSNKFRAVSAQHTFANSISAWGETSLWSRYFIDQGRMGFGPAHGWEQDGSVLDLNGPPWSNLKGYIANSPVLNADKITAAVQLIATDMDVNSDTNMQEMLSALYRQNKEAEMVTYFGEYHWLASPANWTDAWKRIEAFFDRYLKAPVH